MTEQMHDGTYDVRLRGKFTFIDHPGFREILAHLTAEPVQRVVLNLSEVEFVDSAALGMLLLALDTSEKHQKGLIILGAQGQVKKMFHMANFHEMFDMQEA